MKLSLLPSRASAPDHCVECDGPRDLIGPLCSECVDATVLQRLEWRYQNGEGITPMVDTDHWTVDREFHPLHWGLGVTVSFSNDDASVAIVLGPWTLAARWVR